jgi:acetoin utilization deacetylase AcuC-like enzyme
MNVGWFYDPLFLAHETGPSHVECAERLSVVLDSLRQQGLLQRLRPRSFCRATADQIALVHDPAYVNLIQMVCDEGFSFVGSEDTRISAFSYDAATLAVGAVLAACDAVMDGTVTRAFCPVRPPGHHAEADRAMGFCLFNNLTIGAEHLVHRHGVTRIAIVDIDAHHGNGTQRFFEQRCDVLYVSLHERPASLPFPGSGEADETGVNMGKGYTLNIPLSRGSDERAYLHALRKDAVPALESFEPQVLLISAGFDGLTGDPLCHLALHPESYGAITEVLAGVADRFAKGRIISVLEGGYQLDQLGMAVCAHVKALLGSSVSRKRQTRSD